MYKYIKGVKFREYPESLRKPFMKKRFEIDYKDNIYLHQMIFLDFLNVNVKELGPTWVFIVKNDDFNENRQKYDAIIKNVHNSLIPYLVKEYGYIPEIFMTDHQSSLPVEN